MILIFLHFLYLRTPVDKFGLLLAFVFETWSSPSENLNYWQHHFLLLLFFKILCMLFLWIYIFGSFYCDKFILLFAILDDTFDIRHLFFLLLWLILFWYLLFLFIGDLLSMIILNIFFDLDSVPYWNILPFVNLSRLNGLKLFDSPDILLLEPIFDIFKFKLCEYFM